MITNEIIEELKLIIIESEKPDKIILFGSYAKGTANDDSDLDLMVIKESSLPRPYRGKETRIKLSRYIIPKDVVFYTPQEIEEYKDIPCSFVAEVLKTGKVLYES
jgi:predicted nucleotidyltransferase